jgi:uncharacterized protein (TIGR00255 family)
MISMTGFAYREQTVEDISVSVEIKGYNNRFLDMQVFLPPWLSYMEPKVRELIGNYCNRGKVEVFIRIRETNAPLSVTVNTNAAAAYMKAISGLGTDLGIDVSLNVALLIGMEGVLDVEKERNDERSWAIIEPILKETLGLFQAERIREGNHTEEDILNSINVIESSLQTIMSYVPDLEKTIKENIKNRFMELIGGTTGSVAGTVIDENRILSETAILLMKYTISEEISRLSSHLAEFRAEVKKNQSPGKKLDFLCQEINREINTIGSKSAILEVSRAVVEMKEALENIREQLRNIE